MDNSFLWGTNGQLPLEDALRLELPAQRCYVYRIDVGGDTYIGMTTQDPEKALATHVERARDGDTSKLHKALRRFGYVSDLATFSEHDTEVDCLVAKVSQIQRIKPALNSTFGGEGNHFNLIELPNKLGEKVLHVENKGVRQHLLRVKRISGPAYLKSMLERIRHRFDKLEKKLPHERTRFADELWAVSFPISNSFGLSLNKQDVIDYVDKRRKRHALLRDWSDKTQKIADEHLDVISFARARGFKLLTKSQNAMMKLAGRQTRSYEGMFFNPEYFKGSVRVFLADGSSCMTDKVFANDQQAKDWLVQQSWYRGAVRDGIIRAGDAFFPFYIYVGQYGGFLGMFTKTNYRAGYAVVD